MRITRLGHAAVLIEGSKTVLIDPYITDNPAAARKITEIPKIDYILITHDHFDHFGLDAIEIAKRDGSTLFAVHEVTVREDVAQSGIKAVGANVGGTYGEDGIEFGITPAVHSTGSGIASGFVIKLDGMKIYQSGDTSVFSDMKLIPKLWGDIDVALLPIGGHYTMDEMAAALAVEYIKPAVTIPIHYDTWPPIKADPVLFTKHAGSHTKVHVLSPGETYDC
ncbi:MAG: metal-dependent hydrolase [Patescibacteria group bacterium]